MKRKRGNKVKTKKRSSAAATIGSDDVIVESSKIDVVASPNNTEEDNNSSDDDETDTDNHSNDDNDVDLIGNVKIKDKEGDVSAGKMSVESPVKAAEHVVVNSAPVPIRQRPAPVAVYGRVRLKLKNVAKPQPPEPMPGPQEKAEVKLSVAESTVGVAERSGEKENMEKKEVGGGGVGVGSGGEVEERGSSGKESGGGISNVGLRSPSLGTAGVMEAEEGKNLGLGESNNRIGGGIKIVLSKSPNLTSSEVKEKQKETENLGSTESKKTDGGIKIVLSRSPSLSPPDGKDKESRDTVLIENERSGGGIKTMSSQSLSLSSPDGKEKEKESGVLGLTDTKKSGGGIKIMSLKSPSLGRPAGKEKESGGGRMLLEDEEEEEEEMEEDAEEEEKDVKPKVLNKKELEASLEVITKTMKMDAAEPFNVPVNPIELGIPDYFDVIDTPMDFGTIRKNLESGTKYMDSEDVYGDVQYIWDNCYKYNNKGDYIVDLMKRVKKGFMKYWAAAGLYNEQSKIYGAESSGADDSATSKFGKKIKKGKGYKLHKDDCMCAICIMRRRRREREAREAEEAREAGLLVVSPQIRLSQSTAAVNFKQEEKSHAGSPGEDTSSCIGTSPDGDGDLEMEDREIRQDGIARLYCNGQNYGNNKAELHDKEISEKSLRGDKVDIEPFSDVEGHPLDESGSRIMIDVEQHQSVQLEGQAYGYMQQRNELLELEKKRQRLRLLETFRDLENPMLSSLCGALFPNNMKNVWNGPNSLVRCPPRPLNRSNIQEVVASFVNPVHKSASSLK